MNATATIYALALASNHQARQHFEYALTQLQRMGTLTCSHIYLIPCRDAVGADYWNAACLLESTLDLATLNLKLKQLELATGRVRPSHQISLDVDLIAWGTQLQKMQFNSKKLPLALDVKIPMYELWSDNMFSHPAHRYPCLSCQLEDYPIIPEALISIEQASRF